MRSSLAVRADQVGAAGNLLYNVFRFRSKRADRMKILAWDGTGLVLFWKRLEQGAFRWPPISDGVMRLSASQLAALVDGLDWSRLHAHDVPRPTATL